jgi:zinc protease
VEEYVANYLKGDAAPGIEAEYALVQQQLPGIALADVNGAARRWITDENRVVVVAAPRRRGLTRPTERSLLAVFARAESTPVTPYVETVTSEPLVASLPAVGRVTAERTLPGTDITEWALSNGARVLVKTTDFKSDEVLFAAWASGGTSLASNDDYMSALLSTQLAQLGGVGAFSRVDLAKRLSGTAVRLAPTMSETTQGLSGAASPRDLETLLQLAWLQFTAPRRDSAAYQAFRNQYDAILANRGADPDAVFGDTITVTLGQHDFRARPITPATFAEVDLERAVRRGTAPRAA